MRLQIALKSPSKRRVHFHAFDCKDEVKTLRDFLVSIVRKQVADFNARPSGEEADNALPGQEILRALADTGKVSFGSIYNDAQVDADAAVQNAIQSFEDGIFSVFVDEKEIKDLEENLEIEEDSKILFLKLSFLAGRMW